MTTRILSLGLLLAVLSFASAAQAQSRFASPMGGFGWGATSTAGTGQTIATGQTVPSMWGLLGQTSQTGLTGAPTGGNSSATDDFWSLMPMFQLFGL